MKRKRESLIRIYPCIDLLRYWCRRYFENTKCKTFYFANKFLKMSTELNTSILTYNYEKDNELISMDIEEDFSKCDALFLDINFYKDKNYFDTTIVFHNVIQNDPNLTLKRYPNQIPHIYSDYMLSIIFYNFSIFSDCRKFPMSTFNEMKRKDINTSTEDYIDSILKFYQGR